MRPVIRAGTEFDFYDGLDVARLVCKCGGIILNSAVEK
jgi:hypothetical protein